MSNLPEYNILLLGETGAGKSTTINAFANYLKYNTFTEAKTAQFVELISSKFTIPDPKTGNPIVIHSGNDRNERQAAGTSSTQSSVAYSFKFNDRLLRIIDTPGIGDTRGVNIDIDNFDKILQSLYNFKELHGVCILIKAVETRKTAFFKYCITELLTRLHKAALDNIFFCFTFSRNSFYGPGDGFSVLKGFFDEELKTVKFELKPKVNCFFIDNEAYRFLVAKKKGYPFAPGQENDFVKSWKNSVSQTNRMWKYICESKPHSLELTKSLNDLRQIVEHLAEPMAKLAESISTNKSHIETEKKRIDSLSLDKANVSQNSQIDVDDVETKPSAPRIVCTAAKCTETINFQGQTKMIYQTQCVASVNFMGMSANIVGDPRLQGAFSGSNNCRNCGCYWQVHMMVNVEFCKVKRSIAVGNRNVEIARIDNEIARIEKVIDQMEVIVREFGREFTLMDDVSAKLAQVLAKNSISPNNPFIDAYLEMLINEETKKVNSMPKLSKNSLESLKKTRQTHQQLISIFARATKAPFCLDISIEQAYKLCDPLLNLKNIPLYVKHSFNAKKSPQNNSNKEESLDFTNVTAKPFSSDRYFSKKATPTEITRVYKTNQTDDECQLCSGAHLSTQCDGLSLAVRVSRVKVQDLCPVCLVDDHGLQRCTNTYRCTKCGGKHSAIICDK